MVNKLCFVDGCQTGTTKENGPAAFFHPPKEDFEMWKDIFLAKKLVPNSRVCWKHFNEEDVVKGKMMGEQFVPQKRWRLKKGAKPKLLLSILRFHCFPLNIFLKVLFSIADSAPTTSAKRSPLAALSTNTGKVPKPWMQCFYFTTMQFAIAYYSRFFFFSCE